VLDGLEEKDEVVSGLVVAAAPAAAQGPLANPFGPPRGRR
jgi:hypothetical protein